jgi:ribokinase
MAKVIVVGSLNIDLVVQVPRLPKLGETLAGKQFNTFVGGKGNNQAIAAKRAGAEVWLVGNIGKDTYGDILLNKLREDNMPTDFIFQDKTVATGTAHILVTAQGENSIVVVPGANRELNLEKLDLAQTILEQADVLLLQMEVPLEVSQKAAEIARNSGAKVIFNCAPAPENAGVLAGILANTDILILNELEAEIFGVKTENWAKLSETGVASVIVTLGAAGAVLVEKGEVSPVPAFVVEVVDTTAAGDAFCGALAAELARGTPIKEALRFAVAAGALAVTKQGAEPSLPFYEQILELTKQGHF